MTKRTQQLLPYLILTGAVFLAIILLRTTNHEPRTAESSFQKGSVLSGFDFETNRQNPLQVATKTTSEGVAVDVKYQDSKVTFGLPFATKALTQKNNQTISYASANQAVQVDYSITPYKLKEDIILKSAPVSASFIIPLSLLRAEIALSPDGTPVFIDPKTKQPIFQIETPFATDAKGVVTYAAKYKLENASYPDTKGEITLLGPLKTLTTNSQKYNLILEVDPEWLNDPARAYPVTIDPTVAHSTSATFASGQLNRFIDSGSGSSPNLTANYQELPTDPNTVGLWHFNEASGNALDSSGNSNTGTPTGTTVTAGMFSNARTFNGSSDYISIADTNPLDISNSITLESWIYPTAFGGTILVKGRNGDDQENYNFFVGSTGKLNLQYGSPTSTWQRYASTDNVVTLNTWQHVAVTYIFGVPSSARFYINGQGVSGSWTAGTGAAAVINAQPLVIGRLGSYSSDYFAGVIDEVKISNITRTPEEIRMDAMRRPYGVYTSGVVDLTNTTTAWDSLKWTSSGSATTDGETATGSAASALVAQWNFNETSGTTAVSGGSCGTSCNGTLTNFASTGSQDAAIGTGWTSANRRWGAGALMFDGTDDYVAIASDTTLPSGTADRSFEFWMNPKATAIGDRILSYGAWSANNAFDVIFYDTSGTLGVVSHTNNYLSAAKAPPGQWSHVVITLSNQVLRFYVNGILQSTHTTTLNTTLNNGAWWIGNQLASRGANDTFSGTLDSTKIYNRALTPAEILSNYGSSRLELQTRVGSSADPNDGTWEDWKPSTTEAAIAPLDSDSANWTWDSTATYMPKSKSDDAVIKSEGTGSMKVASGIPQTDANTVSLWHLDETGGTGAYIKDSVGTNHGTPTNATVIDGISGKARGFSGTGYVSVPDSSSLDLTSTFTISGWVKLTSTGMNGTLVSKTVAGTTGAYAVLWGSSGEVYCRTNNGTTYTDSYTAQGILAPAKGWTHIAAVKNGTSCRIYINGVDKTSAAASHPDAAANALPLIIGARTDLATEKIYGQIDEVRIDNIARSAEEISESYRAGRDHQISETISSTNLSSSIKLPFSIASDRLGTFSQLTVGESAYANYEPDANTVGLWHLDEQAGTAAYLKDASGNANHGTPTGTTYTQGKVGIGRYFVNSNIINYGNGSSLQLNGTRTIEAWVQHTGSTTIERQNIVGRGGLSENYDTANYYSLNYNDIATIDNKFGLNIKNSAGTAYKVRSLNTYLDAGWHYIVGIINNTSLTLTLYVDGIYQGQTTYAGTLAVDSGYSTKSGAFPNGDTFYGTLDEVRISNMARSADEIRQAYEVGARTHNITIDFKAKLNTNLITGSGDLGFTVDETPYGSSAMANHLFLGDKTIVRENYDGTEYIAQGLVNSVNTSTGAVTVSSWDAGSTFPAAGYTANATVFKWQREYFDLTGSLSTHRDAITRLTYRITDGSLGSTVWLDDLRSSTGYLNDPTGSIIASSTGYRYFQYRSVETSNDPAVSASLNSVTMDYAAVAPPAQCSFHLENNAAVIEWQDSSNNEANFEIQKRTDDGTWAALQTLAANTITYTDSAITTGHKYQYRIAALIAGPDYSSWCTTTDLTVGNNVVNFGGLNMEGVNLH